MELNITSAALEEYARRQADALYRQMLIDKALQHAGLRRMR